MMPQVDIKIGGRTFEVACQDGEETFLQTAAAMLDAEASTLSDQIGRMPEARMLLMAGLMLADKTAALEDKLRDAEAKAERLGNVPVTTQPERVEVPVVPANVLEALSDIATQAEALADHIETKTR